MHADAARMRAEAAAARQRQRNVVRELKANRARLIDAIAGQAAELERLRSTDDVARGRERPELSYLFVVTYGRSGSTLLQGILSSTPGVTIRGENGAVLQDLFRFHDTATRHRERLTANRVNQIPETHPWWGIDGYRDETALRDMRILMLETILRPDPGTRVVGFKEIYWMPERLPDYLAFIRAMFPGARFVLNTRNLDDVAKSKWWARNPDARQELEVMEEQYVDGLAALGDDAYRVHFDDYVADPRVLRGLFEWLGEPWDEDRVRAVMSVHHSY
jgi:Sulfotransferase family